MKEEIDDNKQKGEGAKEAMYTFNIRGVKIVRKAKKIIEDRALGEGILENI